MTVPASIETLILRLPDQTGAAAEVKCGPALREVLHKRASYLASWNGREVFVKLFFHKARARQHWQREKAGIEALVGRALPTPRLLYAGRLPERQAYVLITEALRAALTLTQAWGRVSTVDQRLELLRRAAKLVAGQHEAGILQSDLHAGNFLIADGYICSIDTSTIRVRHGPLERSVSLANLGLLLAQFEPRFDRHAASVFAAYAAARNRQTSDADLQLLYGYIDGAREKRKHQVLKKIFRECTAFACGARADKKLIYDKHYATDRFQQLYRDPERYFGDEPERYLKKGNTSTVVRARIDGIEVVLKRYNIKGAWHGIKRALRRTRASVSWQNAHLLRFYGIDTPRPIAFIENRLGSARRTSYFISEYVTGPSYREFFGSEQASREAKDRLAEQIAEIMSVLGRYRIRHGDMKATNIIIADGRSYLLDLDAMREYKLGAAFDRAHRRDIQRFLDNWAGQQDIRELFAEKISSNV